MKFGTLPEIVKYTEFGKESFALPIGSRSLEHHDGANEEPMLHLVIVAPVLDPSDPKHEATLNIVGTTREGELVRIIHDVPHDSHEFTSTQLEALQRQGISTSQSYPGGKVPGGRWTEVSSAELHNLLLQAEAIEKAAANKAEAVKAAADEQTRLATEAADKAKAEAPAPIDEITREAMIRNKQEELKATPATSVETVKPAAAEPEKPKTPEGGTGGDGTPTVQ